MLRTAKNLVLEYKKSVRYYKKHPFGKIAENAPLPTKAVAVVAYAKHGNGYKVLLLERAKTHRKWPGTFIFGAAETTRPMESSRRALFRGIREELPPIPKSKILGIRKLGLVKAKDVRAHYGLDAPFYALKLDFNMLVELAEKLKSNPEQFPEHNYVNIARASDLDKLKNIQPHYKKMLPEMKKLLFGGIK